MNLAARGTPFRITGIDLRNHLISGREATSDMTCHLEIDLAKIDTDAVPIDGADGDDFEGVAAVLDRTTREWKGWRCSYSTLENDSDKSKRFHAKLRKTNEILGRLLRYQTEALRHAPNGVLRARAEQRGREKALRQRTERAHFSAYAADRASSDSEESSSSSSSS